MPLWTPAKPLGAIPRSAPKRASTSPSTSPRKPERKSPTSSSISSQRGTAIPGCALFELVREPGQVAPLQGPPQRWVSIAPNSHLGPISLHLKEVESHVESSTSRFANHPGYLFPVHRGGRFADCLQRQAARHAPLSPSSRK